MTNSTIEAMARAICNCGTDDATFDELTLTHKLEYLERAEKAAAVLFDALEEKAADDMTCSTFTDHLQQARTDTLGQPRQSDLTADDGAEGGADGVK